MRLACRCGVPRLVAMCLALSDDAVESRCSHRDTGEVTDMPRRVAGPYVITVVRRWLRGRFDGRAWL